VVLVNTNPLWVGLLTPLIARERIKRAAVLSIIISVIGGVIILCAIYMAASAENKKS
jgi:drug/metabolite transporter (DMT)-like permease